MLEQAGLGPDESGKIVPLDTDLQAQIGRQLRAIYDGVLAQPVPDRFLELLDQLDNGDSAAPGTDPASPDGSATKDGE
jgi:hypothetical protein